MIIDQAHTRGPTHTLLRVPLPLLFSPTPASHNANETEPARLARLARPVRPSRHGSHRFPVPGLRNKRALVQLVPCMASGRRSSTPTALSPLFSTQSRRQVIRCLRPWASGFFALLFFPFLEALLVAMSTSLQCPPVTTCHRMSQPPYAVRLLHLYDAVSKAL